MSKLSLRKHILTVDVEDYFQVSAFENIVDRASWDSLEHRVEHNTHKVLDLFNEHNAKATFFVLGWVAKRYPSIIKRIVDDGHELASHGYGHQRLTTLTQQQAFTDIEQSKQILEDTSGQLITGYRAPSFSINSSNTWIYDILKQLNFRYSSSTYPINHDLYGEPSWPRTAYQTKQGILEIPVSTLKLASKNYPIAGGGYYRLLPYWLNKQAINHFVKNEMQPYMFYFHPWEIDPKQPRFKQASNKSKIRHYTNLNIMEGKIVKLLECFNWQSVSDAYQEQITSNNLTKEIQCG
ncbi:XrtA system polysaccharide deacetylase [Thalassomonas sp. M1454]|uniref:XrtA system polysaccharide deacetylase n=1 Tax=Thalassomonas sp. M1454 TaxID=2594477 RepID=UPI001C8F3308|nr:XrtA system polysaccharide deacetylase [Thalassomonas sp. M1454]